MKRKEISLQLTFLVSFIKQQRMHILLANGQGSSTHQYFVSWIDKKIWVFFNYHVTKQRAKSTRNYFIFFQSIILVNCEKMF